ncbi:MAG: hypothetical protein KGO51_05640 [Alphaproteobacteria bacterium]|nr:hypothetical protein [Alphaproteobacteria bacterium]
MRKASEYRQHAADCRALAAKMEHANERDLLLRMAATWEEMAHERERSTARDGEGE